MHKLLHKPNLFHAANYVVQVIAEQKMICYFYTLPQHSKTLLNCRPTKSYAMLHHKPVTKPVYAVLYNPKYVHKTSQKLLYVVCSNQHDNSHKIAPKWQKKIVWKKYQSSRKKQFKITYFVSLLNLSQESTKGTFS